MKIQITLTEDMLGTKALPSAVFEEYIGEKCPKSELVKAETDNAHNTEELVTEEAGHNGQLPITVFHRNQDGELIIYDYQLKGFLKEAGDILRQSEQEPVLCKDCRDAEKPKPKKKWGNAKKKMDNFVFVFPREITLGLRGLQAVCERPLRAMTMKGERISIARSETVPAGTAFVCEIRLLPGAPITEAMVEEALDYGALKGLGQWRNSGKGRFTWKEIDR